MKEVPVFRPGATKRQLLASDDSTVSPPPGWALLLPGDAALTRRVKSAGEHWLVQERKGRRTFSRGVWAPAETIDRIRRELEKERATPAHTKRREANQRRRNKNQARYVEDFAGAVKRFCAFHPRHAGLAEQLARAVTEHATPVGSGTVARTRRIPIERRAEAAVIAWMRHHTTSYDSMEIPRVRGRRRETRRLLAGRSKQLLSRYRQDQPAPKRCPLKNALGRFEAAANDVSGAEVDRSKVT